MTTFTASPSATPVRRPRASRVARVSLWAARVLLSAQFVAGGVLKLTASPQMVAMFDDIGAGQWLRLLVGVCEVAGGIGVLVPRLFRLAAAGLVGLMIGAAVTNVVALQVSPVLPLVLLVLALLVAVARTGKVDRR
jgi:putative oxidoreductase